MSESDKLFEEIKANFEQLKHTINTMPFVGRIAYYQYGELVAFADSPEDVAHIPDEILCNPATKVVWEQVAND